LYTSHHSRSDSSSPSKQLKNISQELKSLQLWRQQEVIQQEKKREKMLIEKESTKNSFYGVESDIDNILSSLKNPCDDVLEEKSMFGAEPYIDINISSTENT